MFVCLKSFKKTDECIQYDTEIREKKYAYYSFRILMLLLVKFTVLLMSPLYVENQQTFNIVLNKLYSVHVIDR